MVITHLVEVRLDFEPLLVVCSMGIFCCGGGVSATSFDPHNPMLMSDLCRLKSQESCWQETFPICIETAPESFGVNDPNPKTGQAFEFHFPMGG